MKKAVPFIFFLIFWSVFLALAGTLTSGFHFTDDHEIVYFSESMKGTGLFTTAVDLIGGDMASGRFRPLYYIHRLVEIKLFGTGFLAWGVYTGVLAWLSSAFFSASLLVWGFGLFEALLFPLLLLLGFQSAIWWRFGPGETLAMFILSVMSLSAVLGAKRKSLAFDALFVLAGILMMLVKETFIPFIPAMLFFKVWASRLSCRGWLEAAKKNAVPIAVLLAASAAGLLFIKLMIGTSGTGYAGYEGFSALSFLSAIVNYLFAAQGWLILAGLALLLATSRDALGAAREVMPSMVLLLLSVVPQALVYAKSGVSERYILPGAFGLAFMSVQMITLVGEKMKARRQSFSARSLAGWGAAAASVLIGAWMMSGPKLSITFTVPNLEALSQFRKVPSMAFATAGFHKASQQVIPWILLAIAAFSAYASRTAAVGRYLNQKTLLMLLAAWAVLFNLSISFDKGFLSALQGRTTNEWIASIEENTGRDDLIVVAGDPALNYEWALSLKRYLNIKSGRTNLYFHPVMTSTSYNAFDSTLINSAGQLYGGKGLDSIPDRSVIKAIVIFPGAEEKFLADSPWLDRSRYRRYVNEYNFAAYYRAY